MMMTCVLLGGRAINIGPWDVQLQFVVVRPAEYAEDGTLIREAETAEQEMNPLPAGAEIVELEVDQDADGGWYAVDYAAPAPDSLEAAVTELKSLKKRTEDVEKSIYALLDLI